MANGILVKNYDEEIAQLEEAKYFNYALSVSGATSATATHDAFKAGSYYALFDGMSDGTVKLSIAQCTVDGQMSVTARTGTTLSQWNHMAFKLS